MVSIPYRNTVRLGDQDIHPVSVQGDPEQGIPYADGGVIYCNKHTPSHLHYSSYLQATWLVIIKHSRSKLINPRGSFWAAFIITRH